MIVLVLGGTRSGKSEVAERLAASLPQPVTYVATGIATDPAMAERIAAHRARRPAAWSTREAGADLVGALGNAPSGTVLVDSLGTWVASHDDLAVEPDELLTALAQRDGDTVVVSEEVGLSIHAPTELGRRFVDALGAVNRAVADAADEVLLVIAGRVLPLDRCPQFERD
jgi:adenosylcobinamide kinase/adenosylcobinamide-phosphate guanylyltransferase